MVKPFRSGVRSSTGTSRATSLAEAIRGRQAELTASERRAARALLADYPMLGLETVAEFAARSGVSSPTVLRFTARLGFANYAAFQRRLRSEVEAQLKSPLAKSAPQEGRRDGHNAFAKAVGENIAETFRHIPAEEFEAVAALLADGRRPLHLLGGRFTDAVAQYMGAHLRILRPGVRHIEGQPGNWRDQLVDIGRRDILFLVDIRRYQEDLVTLAAAAAERRATIVLLTDQWLSPIARIARHVLPARVAVPSPWDSSAALMAVAEALIASVTARNWHDAKARIGALELLRPPEGS